MYEIKNGRSYYYSLLFLRCTFNIPRSFEKSYLKIFYAKYTVITLFSLVFLGVMPALHMIMSIKGNTGVDVTQDLSVCIGDTGCITAGILFTLHYKKWSEFFTEVTIIKKFDAGINTEKFIRNSNRFSILFLGYMVSGVCLYGATSLSKYSYCRELNEEKDLHESCFVFHPVWFPFDTSDMFSTITIFAIQAITILHTVPATGLICFIVLESAEILILHIRILKTNFGNLFEETSNQEISAKLRFCINYHNHILQLGERFNILQKYTVGHFSIVTILMLASILNQMRNTNLLGGLFYLLGCTVALALLCHAGQRISDQTISVGDAVYASNWHKADPMTKKVLAFIIMRCQKPIYLEGIPFGIYDYALFIAILKTSYSFVTVLDGAT